MSGQDSN